MRKQVTCMPGLFVAMIVVVFALGLESIAAPPAATQAEPTNADEAAAKKQAEEAAVNEKYAALVATLSPDEQAWENYQRFSESYKRIRVAFIEAARKRPKEFQRRLNYFTKMTRKNKLIGFGGIEKYY